MQRHREDLRDPQQQSLSCARTRLALAVLVAAAALTATACGAADEPEPIAAGSITSLPAVSAPAPTTTLREVTTTVDPFAPPDWLGQRLLPVDADGFGEVQPTPSELVERRIQMPDVLPAPSSDAFVATDDPVPPHVVERSTWSSGCPVTLDDLRYLTVTFWGFDGEHHRGELLVNAAAADDLVEVFRALHAARYPIEEMRVVAAPELDLAPTGDGNNTTAFVCRPVRGSSSWSEHAYGLAVDLNPFINPYARGELVLPELASAYLDRTRSAAGMIHDDDAVVTAFAAIGWEWGGEWNSLKDYQHFSANGR